MGHVGSAEEDQYELNYIEWAECGDLDTQTQYGYKMKSDRNVLKSLGILSAILTDDWTGVHWAFTLKETKEKAYNFRMFIQDSLLLNTAANLLSWFHLI